MEQMDLFAVVEEQEKETEAKLIFREWQGLPKEKFIREGDPMRAQVRGSWPGGIVHDGHKPCIVAPGSQMGSPSG